MNKLRSLPFTRSISIVQQPAINSQPTILREASKSKHIKDVENLVHNQSMEIAEVKALGKPPTVISIHSPPSVPVYLRRGSLLSLYGDGVSKGLVESSLRFFQPMKRLLYGGYASAYQQVISTSSFTLLVSSVSKSLNIFRKHDTKSFATLFLDGTNDWAILNKNSLQMFTGNALTIGTYRVPKYHSKGITKYTSQNKELHTGIHKWSKLGYVLASGRGHVGVIGNGTMYNITLDVKEELLINRNYLVGISVNGPYDLQNCVIKYSLPDVENDSEKGGIIDDSDKKIDTTTEGGQINRIWSISNTYLSKINGFFIGGRKTISNYIVGNQEFVRVLGPRNILLQSNSSTYGAPQFQVLSEGIPSYKTINKKVKSSSSDFLNYVTIGNNGKATISSTPDFQETVKNIEKKKN